MLPVSILAALLPTLTGGLQQVFNKFLGSAQPRTLSERIQLIEAEAKAAESLASLDAVVGTPSQWVVDLRSALRPIASLVLVCGYVGLVIVLTASGTKVGAGDIAAITILGELAGCAIFYWFGERLHVNLSNIAGKK